MNEYDSQRMSGLLSMDGIYEVMRPEDAGIIIINTCSVREKPEGKTYSEIGRYRKLKDKNGLPIIVVSGCVAEQMGKKIIDRFPHVDVVLGTNNIDMISELVNLVRNGSGHCIETGFSNSPSFRPFPGAAGRFTDFVTIIQGCNNFCSYCIVPYVRGREVSRPTDDILNEIKELVKNGVLEVTLLGQNVNSYRDPKGDNDFPSLIRRVADIDGINRIRFITSHPKDLSDDLISCFGDVDKLCPHIHLPLQSGSNRVLEMMNRGYTIKDYMKKVDALKVLKPDIAITTDIIVGFPGEGNGDFEDTLSVMERVRFDGAYSFKYSKRPGTVAEKMVDDVSQFEKARRLKVLQSLQGEYTLTRNQGSIDSIHEVLATGPSIRDPEELTGKSPHNKVVNFKGIHDIIGSVIPVRVTRANSNSLWGEAVDYNPYRR